MVERQVIVTWYTPEEDLPDEGEIVVVTISGSRSGFTCDHTLTTAEWYENSGWVLTEMELDEFTVHAWSDLEPYGAPELPFC